MNHKTEEYEENFEERNTKYLKKSTLSLILLFIIHYLIINSSSIIPQHLISFTDNIIIIANTFITVMLLINIMKQTKHQINIQNMFWNVLLMVGHSILTTFIIRII